MQTPFNNKIVKQVLSDSPICMIDIGAAGGIDPTWKKYSNNECMEYYGFEPNPENYNLLKADNRTKYFQYAISDEVKTAEFHAFSTLGSLDKRNDREALSEEKYESITVSVETIENLRNTGVLPSVDVVKVDIEGHDFIAIKGIGKYLDDETLYVKSEFYYYYQYKNSNFSSIDDLLTSKGFILHSIQSKTGTFGELEGGDVMYLKSTSSILDMNISDEKKKAMLIKLYVICFYIRNPNYAYIVINSGYDAGIFNEVEKKELVDEIEKNVFILNVLPKYWAGEKIILVLFMLAQLFTGKGWGVKSAPKHNRLFHFKPFFIPNKFLPGSVRQKYHEELEKKYKRYSKLKNIFY